MNFLEKYVILIKQIIVMAYHLFVILKLNFNCLFGSELGRPVAKCTVPNPKVPGSKHVDNS